MTLLRQAAVLRRQGSRAGPSRCLPSIKQPAWLSSTASSPHRPAQTWPQQIPGASVTCTCGATAIEFAYERPRLQLECGCCDCRQAHEWAASRGGPPAVAISRLFYLDNDILRVRGEQNLYLHQLRDPANSTRVGTRCCESILAVDHPAYAGNVVMVPSDACHLVAPSYPPPHARIYMKDYDHNRDGNPPPFCGLIFTGSEPDWVEKLGHRAHFQREVPMPRRGESLQQLFARLPQPATVLGLVQGERIASE
jgi:hypothetical protein